MDHREASHDLRREESGTYGIDEKIHDSAHVENIKGQDVGVISGLSLEEQNKIIWPGIFIIEGAITVVVCAIGWFTIIDFPTQAGKFLKPAEQEFIIARINQDRGDAEEDKIDGAKILHHLKDWRLYFWAFNLMASTLPGYAYSYFLPIILRNGMGFSSTQAQLLSAPPSVLAAIMAYISGWLGDRYKMRGPIIAVHQALTAVGMLITVYGKANGARYFGAFLGK
ncbi:hypothetical protein COL154_005948 [Colletotrichum chrysophilum]|nr:hypothetical protein KNSL1_011071 [Colletotrichum chrysophilum]KAJ0362767.1 hypothetical protein COL154_005948 [Colletotrichum chrysophilum]